MFDWMQFVCFNDHDLSKVDLAVVNHACAAGLSGADRVGVDQMTRTLDEFAERAACLTQNHMVDFKRDPGNFHNSLPYFKALCLVTALQRDCGIRYNPAKIPEDAPFGPVDAFLFGLIESKMGTCANVPVLYAAVGRRLGYPIKIVRAKGDGATHLFARWDDSRSIGFNIEATDQGLRCPPDEYYRTGRYQVSAEMEKQGGFIESMTPREECAYFLAERSLYWKDVGNHRRAAEAMAWASSLSPGNAFFLNTVKMVLNEWTRALQARRPKGFPEIRIRSPFRRFPLLPLELEHFIFSQEALENLLNDAEKDRRWWEPMRKGQALRDAPVQALVDFNPRGCNIRFRLGVPKTT
jgi:hypothetical protein